MVSRRAFLKEVFRTRTSKIVTGLLALMAFYQFACDQFGAPTLPNLWGMTGADALPWWAWLLLAQLGLLYGLFEQVRRNARDAQTVPETREARPRAGAFQAVSNARDNAVVAHAQGSDTTRLRAYHELDAAMLTIENKCGITRLDVPPDYLAPLNLRDVLEIYVRYVDTFFPLLRDGYEEQARQKAATFVNPFAA